MAIRLAALDVDGTLLTPDNQITKETRAAVREAAQAGIEIALSTGRSLAEVRDILRELPQIRYVSCCTGAYVLDLQKMQILYECSMPTELGRAAYRAVRQSDCMVHLFTGLSVRNAKSCMDEFTRYMAAKMFGLIEKTHIIEEDLDGYVARCEEPIEKLYVTFPSRDEYDKAYAAVSRLPVFLTDGGWALDLEVMSRETDKGVALRALTEHLGLSRENVLAMGDSGNDCAMLRYAGVGAAMANAGEEAKQAADVIAPSNREDGVAVMLRRAIRGEL